MHEMSLIDSMINEVKKEAGLNGFKKIKKIRLEVGKLAAVDKEALLFCFEALAVDDIMQGVKLEILEKEGKAFCPICGLEFKIARYGEICPCCGAKEIKILEGNKVFIKDIEVED